MYLDDQDRLHCENGSARRIGTNCSGQASDSVNMTKIIESFTGNNRFLSNFFPVQVEFDRKFYPSVEHAYQAAKTENLRDRDYIATLRTAADAKHYGKIVVLRSDWESVKLGIMKDLLRKKFSSSKMKGLLLATGDTELVEGNWWGDTFWGKCRGVGKNWLGVLLMEIRLELKEKEASNVSM